jgi:hypothetical protein
MKQILFSGFLLCAIFSCKRNVRENKWAIHKGRSLSETKMAIRYPANLIVDSEAYINIYFQNPDFILLGAYVNCSLDSALIMDTAEVTIFGCRDRLYKRKDSIQIYFKTTEEGVRNFNIGQATILFKDNKGRFFASDTIIGY